MKKQAIYEVNDCGCNGPKLLLKEGWELTTISEGLKYHIQEGRMLVHNTYRPLSENYFALFREARELYDEGLLSVTEDDAELLESNIGEYAFYNGIGTVYISGKIKNIIFISSDITNLISQNLNPISAAKTNQKTVTPTEPVLSPYISMYPSKKSTILNNIMDIINSKKNN